MSIRTGGTAALAALLLASCAGAGPAPQIEIDDAWARAAAPGRTTSAAYLTIANTGGSDRLMSVSTPVATASIHSTSMDNGVMRMRPVEAVEIPANSTVRFDPGGTHIMLTGLEQPLEAGGSLSLSLRFERVGKRQVDFEIRPVAGNGAMH